MLERVLILTIIVTTGGGCLSSPFLTSVYSPNNIRDYAYLNKSNNSGVRSNAGIVEAYSGLKTVLYSECKNLPSDSAYLRLVSNSDCGGKKAIFLAMARVLREHDLPRVSPHPPLSQHNRLFWPDLPTECSEGFVHETH